jgi:RNA polymerase sigma-70 factor (ECF subfamily)
MDHEPSDSLETQNLLERARRGDRQAFERLFAQYRSYLCRVVELRIDHRLRLRLDPSDVVQDAQLEAFRRLADYLERRPMPFRLWLHKTVSERLARLRRDHVEAARRSVMREVGLSDESSLSLFQGLLTKGSTPSRLVSRDELARRVRQALAELSESDQEVLLMRTFDGLSFEEVGYLLGIEAAAARKRYGRALVRLQQFLADGGLTESQV